MADFIVLTGLMNTWHLLGVSVSLTGLGGKSWLQCVGTTQQVGVQAEWTQEVRAGPHLSPAMDVSVCAWAPGPMSVAPGWWSGSLTLKVSPLASLVLRPLNFN